MMLSYRRMMGSPPGIVEGNGIMEERRMLKILLRMETMRLRGMLLVGRRLGGGRLLVEWVDCSCFFFDSFLVKRLCYVSHLISGLVLLCFERRLYVGYHSSAMTLTSRKTPVIFVNLLLTR